MFEQLLTQSPFWSQVGPSADVVMTTRVRLARNLPSLPFGSKMNEADISTLESIVHQAIVTSKYFENAQFVSLKDCSSDDRRFLRERDIITYEMEFNNKSSVVFDPYQQYSILVNEEDHIRIQVIKPGLQVLLAFKLADEIDDELNKYISYAFTDDFGFLTTCPSNVGTGLRVSAMLHLPMLTAAKNMGEVIKLVREYQAQLKGIVHDATKTVGSMYIISNKATLGKSEIDIIEEIDKVISVIIDLENEARDEYYQHHKDVLEDMVWRAYGIVTFSRSMSYAEAIEHLSLIRLGVVLSIIKKIELAVINDLMIYMQVSHLQKFAGRQFASSEEADAFRAAYLREKFEDKE
ncbi:MAG: ATP--guanido phosphotransferase [Spirochaetota bacterium]